MIALGTMTVSGCSDEVAGPDVMPGPADEREPRVGSIILRADADTLWIDETTQLHATVLGVDGEPLTGEAVVYTSSNQRVITVSSTGLVTAAGPGTALVTARAQNRNATVGLFVAAASMDLVSGNGQTGDLGKPLAERFVVRATDAEGEGVEGVRVAWSVVSGEGFLQELAADWGDDVDGHSATFTLTDEEGFAQALFTPLALGSNVVMAAADRPGVKGSPVSFTIDGILLFTDLPPFSGSALVYERVAPDYVSRYILYKDRTFDLHYPGGGYTGFYSVLDGVIKFYFDNCARASTCVPWVATGTLRDDRMHVEYNYGASLSGFEDGVYIRSRG